MRLSVVEAVWCVPRVVARRPRQVGGEGGEEVVEGPRDDHVVEEVRVEGDQHDGAADTCTQTRRQIQ